MNIAALVSGGVDSSVVVHRLKEAGVEPVIFYIRIGMQTDDGFLDCPSEEDIEITSFIARKYGLKFEIVPLHKEYWDTVVAYTIDTVKRGLTPNPDVMCNKLIKFGAFEEKYGKDFDFLATGHYARTATLDNIVYLFTAADKVKDQTYFLGQLNAVQISRLMFPIGDLQKHEVREIALQQGLPSATRKDSQGICFLGKINYNDFIRRYLGTRRGKIVDIETGTMLGEHEGFWFHTIGQRKGLGLSGGPWYVIDKNIDDNVIFVARGYDTSAQYGKTVRMRGFRYISGNPLGALDKPASVPVAFKIRHTPEFTFGTLQKVVGTDASCVSAIDNGATIGDGFANNDLYILESDTPLQGIASGQFAVVYDKDCRLCLGSGVIA